MSSLLDTNCTDAPMCAVIHINPEVGAVLPIPIMIGAIMLIHWGHWNFVPSV